MNGLNLGVARLQIGLGWSSTDFYGDLYYFASPTVVYVNPHGNTEYPAQNPPAPIPYKRPGTWLLSDYDEIQPMGTTKGDLNFILPDNTHFASSNGTVLASRQSAMGSGDPPFNSTGKPPIWFAWNDACLSGNDNAFADGYLWPYTNAYDDVLCEDQAEMGWSITTPVGMSRPGAEAVWPTFQKGFTADQARLNLYAAYVNYSNAQGTYPDPSDSAARSTIHVFGDLYARVHGLYTGTNAQATTWYQL